MMSQELQALIRAAKAWHDEPIIREQHNRGALVLSERELYDAVSAYIRKEESDGLTNTTLSS